MAAPIYTDKQGKDQRVYVNPATRVTVPGVTSIIDMKAKPFLPPWYAKMAAELAVDSFGLLVELRERGGRRAVVEYIKNAAKRYSDARSELGTEAHKLFERMIRGEAVGLQRDDLEPYRKNFAEFLDVVRPRLIGSEDIAWSDTHGYAGSFDGMLEVPLSFDRAGELRIDHAGGAPTMIMADWKTGKNTYSDVSMQLTAYARVDRIISADGSERPMPRFDVGAVLHITDDQWSFKPVEISDEVFEFFLALRKVLDWEAYGKNVIGRPLASGGRVATGTERRK